MDSNQIVPIQGENPYELDAEAIERFLKSPDRVHPTVNNTGLETEHVSDPTQTSLVDVPDPDDPMTWDIDFCLDFADEIPCQLGSVQDSGECTEKNAAVGSDYFYYEDTSVPVPRPFNCSSCQVLREIVHSDGGRMTTKLEIHGSVGVIFHAILESHQYFADRPPESYFQMIDFTNKSLEEVRHLMKEYCVGREKEGFFMEQDTYSKFYESVCVGYDWNDILEVHSPTASAEEQQPQQQVLPEETEGEKQDRSHLSIQRERAAKLKVKDLAEYFDYPIQKASVMLNLCSTVLKRKCRQEGVRRWPHRKVSLYNSHPISDSDSYSPFYCTFIGSKICVNR
ncbi:Protein RKD4 [Linum grandiflorum]